MYSRFPIKTFDLPSTPYLKILPNQYIVQYWHTATIFFLRILLKYLIRNDERNTQGGFNDCEMQWCCINYITWEWNQYPGVIYILPFNFFNERWFLVNDLYFQEKKVPLCGWDYYQLLLNKVWCQSILDFSFYLLPLLQV